ncbi:uncharacterized protein B0H18DRAFT_1009950 [Fomitopsis serialis]|uniref:uncharacterized protein n=1 Tax=Fomitopsis serialis TaxID=139415 RepID=UPI0020072B54|nr:uncharacterized protein B0H18DRAFT_1009950 [Neoantrodia serialis]KAH9925122.1 hypothetical protein B0H18DRAFT_1009950 [Neoantrodia serialis]
MSYSFSPGHGLKIPYPNTSTTLTTGRLPTSHYSSSEDTATFTTSSGSSTGQMVSVQDTTYVETENSTLAFTVTGVQSTSASSSLSTSASSSLSTSTSSSLSTSSSSSKIPTPSMSSSTLGSTSVSRTVDRTTIGMAVGTVIGGLCIVGGLLWYWCRRKRVRIRVLFENNMDEPAPGPRTEPYSQAATVPPTATDTMTTAKEPEYMDSEPQNPFVDENAVDLVESVPHSADAVPGFQERIRRPPSSSRALPGDAPPPSATSPSISPPPSFVTQPPSESNRTSFNQHADSGLRFCPDFESQVSVPRCRVVDLPPAYTPN